MKKLPKNWGKMKGEKKENKAFVDAFNMGVEEGEKRLREKIKELLRITGLN